MDFEEMEMDRQAKINLICVRKIRKTLSGFSGI